MELQIAFALFFFLTVFAAGMTLGAAYERRKMLPEADAAARYRLACRDVMTWCCEDDLKAARMTARQIMACGDGEVLNAGTPVGDEACTVNGLREQLRRLRRASVKPDEALRLAAERTRADLGPDGQNYPAVRKLLAFAEQAIAAGER